MNLLILGGTRFVGRHISQEALGRGHDVTVFHRGQSGVDLFPSAHRLLGDRSKAGGLAALAGGTWDAVIDTSGYLPGEVRAAAKLLEPKTKRYLFISSISVYSDFSNVGMDESAPLAADPPAQTPLR